jgi:hypothetical protein
MDVTALPGVIAARGGAETHNKPELSEIVAAMKDVEEERDPMTVNVCGALVTLPKLLTKSVNKMFELDDSIESAVGLNKFFKDIKELRATLGKRWRTWILSQLAVMS